MDLNQIRDNYQNGFIDVNKDRIKQTGESLSLQLDKIKKLQPGDGLEVLIPNPKNSNEYFSMTIFCNKQEVDYSVKNSYGIDHVQGNGEKPLQVHQGRDVFGAIGVSSQGVPGHDNVLYMWSYVDGEVEQLSSDGTYQKAHWSVVSGSTYENWVNSSDFVADMEKMLTEGEYLGQNFRLPGGKIFQPLSKDNIQDFIGELKSYSQSVKFESGQVYGRGSSVRSMTNAPDLFKWEKVAGDDLYVMVKAPEEIPNKTVVNLRQMPEGILVGDLNVQCLFNNSEMTSRFADFSAQEIYSKINSQVFGDEKLKPLLNFSSINGQGTAIFLINDPNFDLESLGGKLYCTQSNEINWVNNRDLIITDLTINLNSQGEPVISLKDASGKISFLKPEENKKFLKKIVEDYQNNPNNTWHNQINQKNLQKLLTNLKLI